MAAANASDKSGASKSDFPTELVSTFNTFQGSLDKLNQLLDVYHSVPQTELNERKELSSLEKAKLDCTSAFALNSLVCMWLRTKGDNPKETAVKAELDRVKASMVRLKEIEDRSKRNPVDSDAAKRMVKSSLWQPKDKKGFDPRKRALATSGGGSRPKRGRK